MIHRADADFWNDYRALPAAMRALAGKQFAVVKQNPQHPSLQFKKIGQRGGREVWPARVTDNTVLNPLAATSAQLSPPDSNTAHLKVRTYNGS